MYIDLLTKIKNAEKAGKKTVKIRLTKMDKAVIEVLEENGFLKKTEIKGKSSKKVAELFFNQDKIIRGSNFLSRPSLRLYAGYGDLKAVKGGQGILVVSTSRGIMTGREARKQKIGGQLLFELW